MDITVLLMMVVAALVVVAVSAYMLNRSWGDSLPSHIQMPIDTAPDPYRTSSLPAAGREVREPDYGSEDGKSEKDEDEENETDEQQAPFAPAEGLLLIEHPALVQAVERMLKQGGKMHRYVMRDGERLYVSLDFINNPADRLVFAQTIEKFQRDGNVDMRAIMRLVAVMGRDQWA